MFLSSFTGSLTGKISDNYANNFMILIIIFIFMKIYEKSKNKRQTSKKIMWNPYLNEKCFQNSNSKVNFLTVNGERNISFENIKSSMLTFDFSRYSNRSFELLVYEYETKSKVYDLQSPELINFYFSKHCEDNNHLESVQTDSTNQFSSMLDYGYKIAKNKKYIFVLRINDFYDYGDIKGKITMSRTMHKKRLNELIYIDEINYTHDIDSKIQKCIKSYEKLGLNKNNTYLSERFETPFCSDNTFFRKSIIHLNPNEKMVFFTLNRQDNNIGQNISINIKDDPEDEEDDMITRLGSSGEADVDLIKKSIEFLSLSRKQTDMGDGKEEEDVSLNIKNREEHIIHETFLNDSNKVKIITITEILSNISRDSKILPFKVVKLSGHKIAKVNRHRRHLVEEEIVEQVEEQVAEQIAENKEESEDEYETDDASPSDEDE